MAAATLVSDRPAPLHSARQRIPLPSIHLSHEPLEKICGGKIRTRPEAIRAVCITEEVVGRTVRSAREGIGSDSTDFDYVIRREAQLLIDYAGSPIIAEDAGGRAPDATGLTRDAVTGPLRLFELLGRRDHTTLLYAPDGPVDVATFERAAAAAVSAAHGRMDAYLIAAPGAGIGATVLPLIRDTAGDFARAYAPTGASAYIVRPDGYLSLAAPGVDPDELVTHLRATFAAEGGAAG
jgi:pentachlorophenol monooxygenase